MPAKVHEGTPKPGSDPDSLRPLHHVQTGLAVRIKTLRASPETTHRLRELGLGEERVIRLLNVSANIICLVCSTRLALSRELAALILVEPLAPA